MTSRVVLPLLLRCCRHQIRASAMLSPIVKPLLFVNRATNPGLVFESSMYFSKGRGDIKKDKKRDKPKVSLTEEELASVIDVQDFKSSIDAVVDALKESYVKSLNIRAGIGLENLEVTFDGDKYPLKDLATIGKKANNLIVLNLASLPDAIKAVLEAINSSGMNVNPQQEGTKIYIQLPRMTHEHREILAKNAKTLFLKAKEELTKIQNEHVKKASSKKGTSGFSDDLIFNSTENIRFAARKAMSDCELLCQQKTKELLGDN